MNTLQKNLTLNSYSNTLFKEFKQVFKQFSDKKVRERLYNNENLLRFLNNVQVKYNDILKDDSEINKLLSSAINKEGKFKFKFLFNNYQSKKALTEYDENKFFKFPDNFDSKFMASCASQIINNKQLYTVEFLGNICGVKINIRFHSILKWFTHLKPNGNQVEMYQKVIRILRRVLFVIKFFEKDTCHNGEHLVFDLFLIDTPKKLPKTRMDKLDQESINSGFTTFFNDANNTKTIIIYRGEEMEKLVIHELIHFFFLDFKQLTIDLSQVLNVSPNIEFIPNESFTEFLTIIIQSGLIPIETKFKKIAIKPPKVGSILNTNDVYKKGIDLKVVFHHALELLYHEIIFGFLQCAKILFQYNIQNTSDFFKKYGKSESPFFYQKSCIISYFFIKVAMLTNINESFAFYVSNQTNYKINTSQDVRDKFKQIIFSSLNKSDYQENIQRALNFINSVVFNKKVVKQIKRSCKTKKACVVEKQRSYKTELSFKKHHKKTVKNLILNTRMSLFEL